MTVLDGQHNIAAFLDDGGFVRHLGNVGTILIGAQTPADKDRALQVAARFSGTGISVRLVADSRHCRLEAMARIVPACALAALLDCRIESLGAADTEDRTLLWSLKQECAEIANANGYAVNIAGLASFVERLPTSAHGAMAAILRSIEYRDIGEIVELAAQMQRAARASNVATPTLDVIARALTARMAARFSSETHRQGPRRRPAPVYRREDWSRRQWALRKTGGDQ